MSRTEYPENSDLTLNLLTEGGAGSGSPGGPVGVGMAQCFTHKGSSIHPTAAPKARAGI